TVCGRGSSRNSGRHTPDNGDRQQANQVPWESRKGGAEKGTGTILRTFAPKGGSRKEDGYNSSDFCSERIVPVPFLSPPAWASMRTLGAMPTDLRGHVFGTTRQNQMHMPTQSRGHGTRHLWANRSHQPLLRNS